MEMQYPFRADHFGAKIWESVLLKILNARQPSPFFLPTLRRPVMLLFFNFLLHVLFVAQISRNGMCESGRHLLGDDDAAS
jgi:hypothetical protein